MPDNASIGVATFGYWVEEEDDTNSLCLGTWGFWPDQGTDVEGVTIYITPDLGWADINQMLNPALNPAVISLTTGDWVAGGSPAAYVSPSMRTIYFFGSPVTLVSQKVSQMHGHNMRYYYRGVSQTNELSALGSFVLKLDPPPIPAEDVKREEL